MLAPPAGRPAKVSASAAALPMLSAVAPHLCNRRCIRVLPAHRAACFYTALCLPEHRMIDRAAIAAARRQLAIQPDFLRTTPLMHVSGRSLGVNCAEVWLKLEHLQVGGSFKARGMLYRLLANPCARQRRDHCLGRQRRYRRGGRCPGPGRALRGLLCPKSRPRPNAHACAPWVPKWWLRARPIPKRWRPVLRASRPPAPCRPTPTTSPRWWQGGRHAGAGDRRTRRPPAGQRAGQRGRRRPHRRRGRLVCKPRPRGGALEPERAPTLHAARAAGQFGRCEVGGVAPIHWVRAASVRCAGRSANAMCTTRCCCPTRPSAPPNSGCGRS